MTNGFAERVQVKKRSHVRLATQQLRLVLVIRCRLCLNWTCDAVLVAIFVVIVKKQFVPLVKFIVIFANPLPVASVAAVCASGKLKKKAKAIHECFSKSKTLVFFVCFAMRQHLKQKT